MNIEVEGEDIPVGKPATEFDKFLLAMGMETFRQSVPALNDVLGKLLTLNTALIGAGFLAVKEGMLPFWGGFAAVLAVLLSLVATLLGLYPREGRFRPSVPAEILAAETRVVSWKAACLRCAFAGLVSGLFVAVCGLAWTKF